MDQANREKQPRRVLIASSHPLFGLGLRSLLQQKHAERVEVVGMVANIQEALAAIDRLNPDLVIVDYDDEALNREAFLKRFMEGEKKLRVVLLSLHTPGDALVYDRRTLAASQVDNWLEEWTYGDEIPVGLNQPPAADVRKEKAERNGKTGMKHLIVAAILVVVVTALLLVGLNHVQLLPIAASAQAAPIDSLFHLEFQVIAFLFSLIVVFMVYSIVVFRRKKGDLTDAAHVEGSMRLEIAWTVAPLLTVLFFAYLGGQSLADTLRPDPQPLEVNVTGSQWAWRFEYPDSGIVSNELVLPVNRQALLHLSSTDVIHSFWVPEFRVKQDALPGGTAFVRDLRITPTKTGDYKVRCAEMCGLRHAYMESPVRVVADADYQAWLTTAAQAGQSTDPVERGRKLAQQNGCLSCHSTDGSKMVGPSWKGLYGHEVTLDNGSKVTADDAYIKESIKQPGAKVVQGFPNIMPAAAGASLTDEQMNDIIAFIKTLK